MAGIALDVFALLTSSALGIIGILFPDSGVSPTYLQQGHSLLKIGIGLNSSVFQSLGGTIPSVKAYNEERVPIGLASSSSTSNIDAGKFVTVPVIQNMTYQQPTYIEVAGGVDAVCIAYLAQTWSDGTQLGWLGDMGRFCGAKWYYSNLYVNTHNGSMYKPYCTWIGGSRAESELYTYTGFRIHTPDFGAVDSSNAFTVPANPVSLCDYPKTEWYKEPIFRSPAARLQPLSIFRLWDIFAFLSFVKNAIASPIGGLPSWPRDQGGQKTFKSSIIASHDAQHSGEALCESSTSWGPDFVSFEEGLYCDMTLKKIWPLCDEVIVKNCYDWDTHVVVDGRRRKREIAYRRVIEWE